MSDLFQILLKIKKDKKQIHIQNDFVKKLIS